MLHMLSTLLVAMKQEMKSLAKNKTWVIVDVPRNKKAIRMQIGFQEEGGINKQ